MRKREKRWRASPWNHRAAMELDDFWEPFDQRNTQVLFFFAVTAFAQNSGICGSPVQICKGTSNDPTQPGSEAFLATPTGVF
ncbi:hypothetical protein EV1_014003 [Malus domestica]